MATWNRFKPPPVRCFSLTVPGRFFCRGLFLLWFVFDSVCRLLVFVLDGRLVALWVGWEGGQLSVWLSASGVSVGV